MGMTGRYILTKLQRDNHKQLAIEQTELENLTDFSFELDCFYRNKDGLEYVAYDMKFYTYAEFMQHISKVNPKYIWCMEVVYEDPDLNRERVYSQEGCYLKVESQLIWPDVSSELKGDY